MAKTNSSSDRNESSKEEGELSDDEVEIVEVNTRTRPSENDAKPFKDFLDHKRDIRNQSVRQWGPDRQRQNVRPDASGHYRRNDAYPWSEFPPSVGPRPHFDFNRSNGPDRTQGRQGPAMRYDPIRASPQKPVMHARRPQPRVPAPQQKPKYFLGLDMDPMMAYKSKPPTQQGHGCILYDCIVQVW